MGRRLSQKAVASAGGFPDGESGARHLEADQLVQVGGEPGICSRAQQGHVGCAAILGQHRHVRQRRLKGFGDQSANQGDVIRDFVGDHDDIRAEGGGRQLGPGHELQHSIADGGDQRLEALVAEGGAGIDDGQRPLHLAKARHLIGGLGAHRPQPWVGYPAGDREECPSHLLAGDDVTHRELHGAEATAAPPHQGTEQEASLDLEVLAQGIVDPAIIEFGGLQRIATIQRHLVIDALAYESIVQVPPPRSQEVHGVTGVHVHDELHRLAGQLGGAFGKAGEVAGRAQIVQAVPHRVEPAAADNHPPFPSRGGRDASPAQNRNRVAGAPSDNRSRARVAPSGQRMKSTRSTAAPSASRKMLSRPSRSGSPSSGPSAAAAIGTTTRAPGCRVRAPAGPPGQGSVAPPASSAPGKGTPGENGCSRA